MKKNIWEENIENNNVIQKKNNVFSRTKTKNKNIEEQVEEIEEDNENYYSLFGEEKKKFNFKKVLTILIIIFSILLFIFLPLFFLFSTSIEVIDNPIKLRHESGFVIEETNFRIKHNETNRYISDPDWNSENIKLEEEGILPNYSFTFETNKTSNKLWIQSDKNYEGNFLTMKIVDDKPVWSSSKNSSGISLQRKDEESNLYGIRFENSNEYLSYDGNSYLTLSNKPDWFYLEADTSEYVISSPEEYVNYYEKISNQDIEIGISGNPLSIQSTKTDKWLNTSNGKLIVGNKDENFFIPKTTNEKLSLGSYKTLNLIKLKSEKRFYPLLTNEANSLILKQFVNGHNLPLPLTIHDIEPPEETWVVLEANPNNLKEFSIKINDSYVYTSDENVLLNPNPDLNEIEYFRFVQSEMKNPEVFTAKLIANSNFLSIFDVGTENAESVEKYTINAWGINLYKLHSLIVSNEIKISDLKPEDKIYYETISQGNNTMIYLNDLNPELTYFGYITLYRKDGVGSHITKKILHPFGREIISKKAENVKMWNSTPGNVDIWKSSNTAEVSIDFVQGRGLKYVNKLSLKVEKKTSANNWEDVSDTVGNDNVYYYPVSKTYKFLLTDLEPETEYRITTIYDKDEMYETDNVVEYDTGQYQIDILTEREWPLIDDIEIKNNIESFLVLTLGNSKENDTLHYKMTVKYDDGTEKVFSTEDETSEPIEFATPYGTMWIILLGSLDKSVTEINCEYLVLEVDPLECYSKWINDEWWPDEKSYFIKLIGTTEDGENNHIFTINDYN